jgi:hypothetical protein
MPRTSRPAGSTVDKRNGRRIEIGAAVPLEKFGLPKRTPPWSPSTRKAWAALWDDPIRKLWSVIDRPVLLRWADAQERAVRALALADLDPISKGSMGQEVENPLYGVADKAVRVAQACEAQLGVGALNRNRLGIEAAGAFRSLAEVNAAFADEPEGDDADPRG